jgi:hypothetical protein
MNALLQIPDENLRRYLRAVYEECWATADYFYPGPADLSDMLVPEIRENFLISGEIFS